MQPQVVPPQDKVMQLQVMQRLRLSRVQATQEATGADVNGALAGERAGILSGRCSSRQPPKTHSPQEPCSPSAPALSLTWRWQCCRTLPGPSRTGPSSRQLITELPAISSCGSCEAREKLMRAQAKCNFNS